MGSFILAAVCDAVWEEIDLFDFCLGDVGNDGLGVSRISLLNFISLVYPDCGFADSVCSYVLFAIYRAYAKSNGQWAARSVILGFFVAPIEALPEISVTDVVSSHSNQNLSTGSSLTMSTCSTSPTNAAPTWASTPYL